MPWFPLSDDLNDDPRFVGLSDSALALWTRAAAWSARRLTDGHVPTAMIVRLSSVGVDVADELVEAGAWKRARGGWQMVDFPESAKAGAVSARRAADRNRQREHRRSGQVSSRRDNDVTPVGLGAESDASYTHTYEGLFEGGEVAAASKVEKSKAPPKSGKKPLIPMPDDWKPTDNHRAFAEQHGLDLDSEEQRFRWKVEAEDWRYASWNGGFSTWLGNAKKWQSERRPGLRAVGGVVRDSRGRRTEVG